MIKKKQETINELIFNQTVYNEGKNVMFPNLSEFNFLMKKIIALKVTTQYISFTPWYCNTKLKSSICFEEYKFSIECYEQSAINYIIKKSIKGFKEIFRLSNHKISKNNQDIEMNFNPVCSKIGVKSYHKYLNNYLEYLDTLIPIMFNEVIKKYHLTDDDLAFGYFCFEIHNQ